MTNLLRYDQNRRHPVAVWKRLPGTMEPAINSPAPLSQLTVGKPLPEENDPINRPLKVLPRRARGAPARRLPLPHLRTRQPERVRRFAHPVVAGPSAERFPRPVVLTNHN